MKSESMKAQIQIATLAVLTAMSPLALANPESKPQQQTPAITEYKYNAEYKSIDKADISSPDGATLAQHIGKTMFVKGQLTRMPNGRIGIIPNETPASTRLTGRLCHMTSTTLGNVPENIGYPQIPYSHFFFSVNDVTFLSTGAPTQK